MKQTTYLEELAAADQLEAELQTSADAKPEDLQALDELRADVAQKRREEAAGNIGQNALMQLRDGSTAPVEEVQQAMAAGHEAAGPYNGGAHTSN